MGVRFPSVANTTLNTAVLLQNTETVVIISPPINLPLDGAQVFIEWWVNFAVPASTTFLNYSIRRGSTTGGTRINVSQQVSCAAALVQTMQGGFYIDSPGIVGGQQYCLTMLTNGATGTSAITDACIGVFVL